MEKYIIFLSYLTAFLIPFIVANVLYNVKLSTLKIFILFGCFIWMISVGSLITIKLAEYRDYKNDEDVRFAQLLIDSGFTNSINTNIQYNIDKLLFEKQMKEKYGR